MYTYKDVYVLDFSNVCDQIGMHEVIRDGLDFPDYYGCNLDAFWDCLNDMLGRPINIEIVGFEVIEQKFGDIAKKILDILVELKHCEGEAYVSDINIWIVNGDERISL